MTNKSEENADKKIELDYEFDFEFVKGQHHYQTGGEKDELEARPARAGWESERFQHEKKTKKAEFN